MLFGLKRCIFYTQIRQLSIFNTCIKNYTKTVGSYSLQLKCLNLKNSNLSNLIHTNPEEEKKIRGLPSLMRIPNSYFSFAILEMISSYFNLCKNVDKNFKLIEFLRGADQAISVISNALVNQNYEILEGLVKEKALELLKHRVNLLTPEQLNFLLIPCIDSYPCAIKIWKTQVENETFVEIAVGGTYFRHDINNIAHENELKIFGYVILSYVYVFQRKYINGTGGSWVVKALNHEGISTNLS